MDAGQEAGGETSGKSGIYALPCIRQMASGKLLCIAQGAQLGAL